MDIIERLEDEEMCIDAIDDAIHEIKCLREIVSRLTLVAADAARPGEAEQLALPAAQLKHDG